MSAQTPQKFTLEEISLRKKKLLNEIHAQKKAMTATTREIFAPIAPANQQGRCYHAFIQYGHGYIRRCDVGGQSYEEGAHVFQEFKIIRSSH